MFSKQIEELKNEIKSGLPVNLQKENSLLRDTIASLTEKLSSADNLGEKFLEEL